MTVDFQELDGLLTRIKLLPPEYRLRLMQGILETLVPTRPENAVILQFGAYEHYDGPMSTIEDYAVAEWRPSERELNGG
jgi:hypothetical protein